MKIAVVASLVTPLLPAQPGGAQAFVSDLARGLAGRGHQVTLYCAAGSEVEGVELAQVQVDSSVRRALVMPSGVPGPPVPALRRGFEALFAELRRRGADAISQHAFDPEAFELTQDLPVLHTLHLPPISPAVVAAAASGRFALATVSNSQRRLWAAAGAETCLLPNGVPAFDLADLPTEPVALIAGRISPEKGTAAAIRVARRSGLRPLVVGDVYDPAYFEREVFPLLTEAPRQLPRPALWELMARSAVTLMPVDWEEPFGLVAVESQMAGCPVAGYRRGALPEVVVEGVGGRLVEVGDEGALAEAALACLALPRAEVRRSVAHLSLDASLTGYERALGRVAR